MRHYIIRGGNDNDRQLVAIFLTRDNSCPMIKTIDNPEKSEIAFLFYFHHHEVNGLTFDDVSKLAGTANLTKKIIKNGEANFSSLPSGIIDVAEINTPWLQSRQKESQLAEYCKVTPINF